MPTATRLLTVGAAVPGSPVLGLHQGAGENIFSPTDLVEFWPNGQGFAEIGSVIAGPAPWPSVPFSAVGRKQPHFIQIGADPVARVSPNAIVRSVRRMQPGTPSLSVWDWDGTGQLTTLILTDAIEMEGPGYDVGEGFLYWVTWESDNKIRLYRSHTDLTRPSDGQPGGDLVGTETDARPEGVWNFWLTPAEVITGIGNDDLVGITELAYTWPRGGDVSSPSTPTLRSFSGFPRSASDTHENYPGIPVSGGSFRINVDINRTTTTSIDVGGSVVESVIPPGPPGSPGFGNSRHKLMPDGKILVFESGLRQYYTVTSSGESVSPVVRLSGPNSFSTRHFFARW